MFDAMDSLKTDSIGSTDTILLPVQGRELRALAAHETMGKTLIESICGKEPKEVVTDSDFVVARFGMTDSDEEVVTQRERFRKMRQQNIGFGPADRPRLQSVSIAPHLCYTSSGGLRKFSVDNLQLHIPVSPYELRFNLAHSSIDKQQLPGIFSEQHPLGFACHVTSSSRPLGLDWFACVAGNLQLTEAAYAVRASDATLLSAEQILYACTTLCTRSMQMSFGFRGGPGGSAEGAHASMGALRLHTNCKPIRHA